MGHPAAAAWHHPLVLRRRLALAFSLLTFAGLPAVASAAARPVLFVGNLGDGTVSLIDPHSFQVIGKLNVIPDGNTPQDPAQAAVYPALVRAKGTNYVQGIAVSPDGRTLYVSRGFLGDVAALDIASGRLLWRLQVSGVRADHLALSPDGRRLFVSALSAGEVQVIDTATHAFIGSFPTGDWPHVLEFSPDGRYVYNGSLGNQLLPQGLDGQKQLTVADPNTLQVVRTYQFDAGVRPFVFASDGRTMFLQLSYYNGFLEFDLSTGQIVRRVALPVMGPGAQMQPKDYPNQAAHHGLALSPDGRYVCDAGTISNYVALVSRPALKVAAIIPVGDQPAEAHTSLDGQYCFVSNRGPGAHANFVSVISYAARREIARIPTGDRPQEETEAMVPDAVVRAPAVRAAAPRLAAVRMTRRRFSAGRGTAFRFTLSRAARVTAALERLLRGGRTARAGSLTFAAHAGRGGRRFSGRIHGRPLRPGGYRARVWAVSADGLRSRLFHLRFRVMR
jgi:DNA-binding beta-propeller fold protein YncE